MGTQLCLTVVDDGRDDVKGDDRNNAKEIIASKCNTSDPLQQWSFEEYTHLYDSLALSHLQSNDYLKHLAAFLYLS